MLKCSQEYLPMQCVHFSAETDPDSQAAAAHNTFQDPAASLRKPEALPTFYSASHAVSNLAPSSSALRAPERIRDAPVRERIGFLAGALLYSQLDITNESDAVLHTVSKHTQKHISSFTCGKHSPVAVTKLCCIRQV